MKICYYLEASANIFHELGAASIRQTKKMMPEVEIIHLAGPDTEPLEGATRVHRASFQGLNKFRHMAEFHMSEPGSDVLVLDVDVLVQADLTAVFRRDFDLAVSYRHIWMKDRPYNGGVVFSRCPAFWAQLSEEWELGGRKFDDSFFCATANCGKYRLYLLPGLEYNYIPVNEGEDFSEKKVVHFAGPRKAWMQKIVGQEVICA
jgi:hypothetical protein